MNSTISDNSSTSSQGCGIYNDYSTLIVANSTISGNLDGGIYNDYSTLIVTNSTISGNSTYSGGGGIRNYKGKITVTNSTISGNSASYSEGGGIFNSYGTITITNSTISGNSASSGGGGISNEGTLYTYNTIIALNTASYGADISNYYRWTITAYNSLSSYTEWSVENNIVYDSAKPLFRSIENGDYRLVANSQAINKGDNQYAYNAGMDETGSDLEGQPRFISENIDIGAYEFDGISISQNSIYVGEVSLSWVQYKNTDKVRISWISGTNASVLGLFKSAGEYLWDTTKYIDGYGQLKIEYLDVNEKVILSDVLESFILNDSTVAVHRGEINASDTWEPGKIHLVVGKTLIKSGATLTIANGAMVKFWKNAYLYTESGSTLTIQDNAVLTRAEDDEVGGDTNKDGNLSVAKNGNSYLRGTGMFEFDPKKITQKFIIETTSGTISADQTWLLGQVYHVIGDITVASGATLTILPGAIVKFDPGCSLMVEEGGTLVAEGNSALPIVFTSVKDDSYGGDTNEDDGEYGPNSGDWNQIGCMGGTISMDHVIIQYCSSVNNEAGILINSGNVTFNNSRISYTEYDAMRNYGGNFKAYNSIFEESSMALSPRGGTTEIINCVIANSTTAIRGTVGNLINTIIYNITSVIFDWGTINCKNCVIFNPKGTGPQSASVVGINGNIWANPLFRDAKNGDYRLRAGSPCIDAGDGTVASLTDITGAPRYTDLYSTQTGTPNKNSAYVDIGAYEFTDTASSSIDLEPIHIQATPGVTPVGEKVTLQWTIRNNGTVPAIGTWTDEIYLVSEMGQRVHVSNISHSGNIIGGDTQTFFAEVLVPNVSKGAWTFAVNVNPNREIFEGVNVNNNTVQAAAGTNVSVPVLTDTSITIQLLDKQTSKLYQLEIPANQPLFIQGQTEGNVSILLGHDRVPTVGLYDYSASSDNAGNYTLFVPASDTSQTCYLLVSSTKPTTVSLQISDTSFDLTGITQSEVSNAGASTIGFIGAGFVDTLSARLKMGSLEIAGTNVTVNSGSSASARFDLTGVAAGTYNLIVSVNGQERTLENAVTVNQNSSAVELDAKLVMPESVREGRIYSATVEYSTPVDWTAPIFVLQGSTGVLLSLTEDFSEATNILQVVGTGSNYVDVITGQMKNVLSFYYKAASDTSISVSILNYDDADPCSDTTYFATWKEYHESILETAVRLDERGEDARDVSAAYQLAVMQIEGYDVNAISGILTNSQTGEAITDSTLIARWTDDEGEIQYRLAKTDEKGHYCIEYLPKNVTVSLSSVDVTELSQTTIQVGEGDVNKVKLTAVPVDSSYQRTVAVYGDLTAYIEYRQSDLTNNRAAQMKLVVKNTSNTEVAAPVLTLSAENGSGQSQAILSLDEALKGTSFATSIMPDGYFSAIQWVANGQTEGTLQAGESVEIPVYWAGWVKPWDSTNFSFNIRLVTEAETESFSPLSQLTVSTDNNVGGSAFTLEFSRSCLGTITGRNTDSTLGYGWDHNWNYSLTIEDNGNVTFTGPHGSERMFRPTRLIDGVMQYRATSFNDTGTFVRKADGSYVLTKYDLSVYTFNADGQLLTCTDSNGNVLSMTYNALGQLTIVSDSQGNSLTLAYHASGKISSVTDSNGDATTYQYDGTGNFLTLVT